MWIFDSYFKGSVEIWSRERGLSGVSSAYPPSFYMHLKDPHAHWDMIEGLESRYKVEECSFNDSSAMIPESVISVGLLLIFELTGMIDFSINNGRSRLVEWVGPHSQ